MEHTNERYPILINGSEVAFIQPYTMQYDGKKLVIKDNAQYSTMRLLIEMAGVGILRNQGKGKGQDKYKEIQEDLDYLDKAVDLLNFSVGLLQIDHSNIDEINNKISLDREQKRIFERGLMQLFHDGECVVENLALFSCFAIRKALSLFDKRPYKNLTRALDSVSKDMSKFAENFMNETIEKIEV